jgi:hypothetical protein
MKRTKTTPVFLSEIMAELGSMPRLTLVYFGGVGALSALLSIIAWPHRPHLEWMDTLGLALLLVASLLATYGGAMKMIGHPWSYRGLALFLTTLLAMFLPILPATVFMGLTSGSQLWAAASLLASLLGIILITFLPGWPIMQATSSQFIGPWAAFRSTEGLRWQLFLSAFLTNGLNKALPPMSTAEDLASASVLAGLGGIITCLTLMLAAAIAVSAWRHMTSEPADLAHQSRSD